MISVVIPAYNEEENVAELHRRLKAALEALGVPYEIIIVENGSHDRTMEVLRSLSPIKIVRLRKNFGQAGGIDAGFSVALGDIVMTMDGDLQNDPDDIGRIIAKLNEGYDIVVGWRRDRHDLLWRKVHSRLANWLTGRVTGLHLHDHACALKAYRRQLLDGVTLYGEMHVFLPAFLVASRGATVAEVAVSHHERASGMSKHHLMRGVKAISDLFTVKFLSTTIRPLLVFTSWGLGSFGLASMAVAVSVFLRIAKGIYFSATPLPVMATLFIVVGFLFIMMGFLAELMLRIYYDTQHAKPYSVKEIIER
ncbi:MAG: glycosyltransferase family 2 protein [Candidatus Sungbacteria bacterium]|uniref:Glycosyltransferase family 2 protein n=1 Tax=Candidatus Sungiibacteriota bacterium TaxID=2750080 RepID=A0A932R182_9BACT|nr:glycosyltransferase family 2 protein [Candidatus Sungbacteria bacterium]